MRLFLYALSQQRLRLLGETTWDVAFVLFLTKEKKKNGTEYFRENGVESSFCAEKSNFKREYFKKRHDEARKYAYSKKEIEGTAPAVYQKGDEPLT